MGKDRLEKLNEVLTFKKEKDTFCTSVDNSRTQAEDLLAVLLETSLHCKLT